MVATRRSTRAAKAAPGIDTDFSDVDFREDEIYDGEQPTKGMYRLKLIDVKDHESGEGNSSIKWVFQIMEGEQNKHGDDVAGWRGYKYTNTDAAKWVTQKIAVALGLIKAGGKLKMSYADILKRAKPCRALIVMERYIPEDGEPEWRAGLGSAFMPDGVGTKAKAKSKEAEEDDEPEDEDDEPPPRASRSRRKADPEPEPEDEEEDDDEEEDGEEVDPDELAEELEALSLAALKKRAREEYGVKITRGMDADAIIDAVLETLEGDEEEEDDDEEEPEPEPEPAKRPARSSRGSARTTKSKRSGYDDEPPF